MNKKRPRFYCRYEGFHLVVEQIMPHHWDVAWSEADNPIGHRLPNCCLDELYAKRCAVATAANKIKDRGGMPASAVNWYDCSDQSDEEWGTRLGRLGIPLSQETADV